ncbi:MAG: GNAT family N-acetyltransferase [Crenarchaeota archaeon]|nr:GNAT family N-acetyltransferase [Thermoproteota archaeon]
MVRLQKIEIDYIIGDETLLDRIEPLWLGLNQQTISDSLSFKPYYRALTFDKRKTVLMQKAQAAVLRVELAIDKSTNHPVGYCVTSLDNAGTGEIESIYVDKAFRGLKIGDTLMKSALAWLEKQGSASRQVSIAAGNENACRFYERYGFRTRRTVMEQAKNSI